MVNKAMYENKNKNEKIQKSLAITSNVNYIESMVSKENKTNKETKMTKTTKRDVIKMLMNRTKIYRVSDYVRKVNAVTGKTYSATEIKRSMYHMAHEGQIAYSVVELTNSQSICGVVIAA